MSREEVEQTISKSETLTKIDRVCKSLSKPDDFVELKKQLFGNSIRSAITYQYKTSRSFDDIIRHFKMKCAESQCVVISESNDEANSFLRSLNMRMENVDIGIEYRPKFGSLVNFGCSM